MRFSFFAFLFIINILSATVFAQDDGGFSKLAPLPPTAMDDGAPIRMTPEGPAVIQLEEDATSLIVGNPTHATAILESPRQIILIPQQPGATKIMALDKSGKAILSRHVLVGGGKSGFIRINRACANATAAGCQPVAMYYCPDRCYQTNVPEPGAAVSATGDAAVAAPAAPGDVPSEADVPDSIGENPIDAETQ